MAYAHGKMRTRIRGLAKPRADAQGNIYWNWEVGKERAEDAAKETIRAHPHRDRPDSALA